MALRATDEQAAAWGADVPNKRSKYGNRATVVDGIRFASMKESRRYSELKLLQLAGKVKWFIMQPQFRLPGGTVYRADFLVVWSDWQRGPNVTVEDCKGFATAAYKIKRREVEAKFGFKIIET